MLALVKDGLEVQPLVLTLRKAKLDCQRVAFDSSESALLRNSKVFFLQLLKGALQCTKLSLKEACARSHVKTLRRLFFHRVVLLFQRLEGFLKLAMLHDKTDIAVHLLLVRLVRVLHLGQQIAQVERVLWFGLPLFQSPLELDDLRVFMFQSLLKLLLTAIEFHVQRLDLFCQLGSEEGELFALFAELNLVVFVLDSQLCVFFV